MSLAYYLWQSYGCGDYAPQKTRLPEKLRNQFLDEKERNVVQEFHEMFYELLQIKLHPNFPIEKVFGN